jgi:hypothetical protein
VVKEGEPRLLLESVILGIIGTLNAWLFRWMLRVSLHFFLFRLAGYQPPLLLGRQAARAECSRRRCSSERCSGGGLISHEPSAVFAVVGMAAVFGAAARVPVATMLMVTEMAGGYHLLVPAGVAVMLSYLLQVRLSSFFRYRSLYEGQIRPGRTPPRTTLSTFKLR